MNSHRCSLLLNTSFKTTSSNQSALYLIITKFLALSAAARTSGGTGSISGARQACQQQFSFPPEGAEGQQQGPGLFSGCAGSHTGSLAAGLKRVLERQVNGTYGGALAACPPSPYASELMPTSLGPLPGFFH